MEWIMDSLLMDRIKFTEKYYSFFIGMRSSVNHLMMRMPLLIPWNYTLRACQNHLDINADQ